MVRLSTLPSCRRNRSSFLFRLNDGVFEKFVKSLAEKNFRELYFMEYWWKRIKPPTTGIYDEVKC